MGSAFQTLLHIQRMAKKETDELLFIYLFIYLFIAEVDGTAKSDVFTL